MRVKEAVDATLRNGSEFGSSYGEEVEYEGERLSETDGIIATKKLLEKIRDKSANA